MKDKKKLVLTINREYGSGGRIVGKRLSQELGINFYDEEILRLTAEKSAVGEQYFRLADEKAGNNLLYRIVSGMKPSMGTPSIGDRLTTDVYKRQASWRWRPPCWWPTPAARRPGPLRPLTMRWMRL